MGQLLLRDVKKAYGKVDVLWDIDLEIEKGEFIVFVGPSGCGKSTLLRMIAGLEEITGGEFFIDDVRMNDVPPAQRGIAMVFQSYALYPHMSVRENMAFGLKLAKTPKDEINRLVGNAARILQLEPYLDRLPKALSGGQRQRVAIGRSIVRNPKVFLFDEPLSNLDAALRVATRIEIAKLHESLPSSTMIYVTHDQVEAMTLADRIVVLNGGIIEQVGAPLELYEHPRNVFVAGFIGSPKMNVMPAILKKSGKSSKIEFAGATLDIPITTPKSDEGHAVYVGVRPEDLAIGGGKNKLLSGKVDIVESLGENTLLYLEQGEIKTHSGEPIVVKLPGIVQIERHKPIQFAADPAKLHLFDKEGIAYSRG